MGNSHNYFLLLSLAILIPTLNATFSEFDTYWQERAKTAELDSQAAYSEDPYEVSLNFSASVNQILAGKKDSRRNLKGNTGSCMATNPIDACWRCDPNWANDRQKLADCVQGFGRNTVGGKGGPFYVVTDPSDDHLVDPKPGTLRHAVTRDGPLWITFDRSMRITLKQELIVSSNKTIDGRGVDVYITEGAGIMMQFVKNIIIHGVKIYNIKSRDGGIIRDSQTHFGLRTRSDGDGITMYGSSNVWIDHVSMRNCTDGLIDAIMGSTAITISNSHFTDHNKVMLFGAGDIYALDKILQITLAFNHFGKRLIQRMPRGRYGFVHTVNNDYTHWKMYAIGGSSNVTFLSEGNRFIAPNDAFAKQITKREVASENVWAKWQWKSVNDLYMNGAFFVESGPPLVNRPFNSSVMITAKPGHHVAQLTRYAGIIKCRVGHPC